MIAIGGILKEDSKKLYEMYYDYYRSILGEDWTKHIPIKPLRNFLDINRTYAEFSVKEAFSEEISDGMIAKEVLGLYEDDNLLGFACIGIFEDLTGGIYHIYVKPEYRKKFIDNFKNNKFASEYLMEGIEDYFTKNSINTVEVEVPHKLLGIKRIVEKGGFILKEYYTDATKYVKER